MRLFSKDLIPYLPDLQLKGQWKECALIAGALAKNGTPNHLLVNKVTEYPLEDFWIYCEDIACEMKKRKMVVKEDTFEKILENLYDWKGVFFMSPSRFQNARFCGVFRGWHNKEYLRVCMANLYEKYRFGVGKSKISQEEWDRVLKGYKNITGEEWEL